jgi:ABC-type transporter Mla subunit MlaD
LSGWEVGFLVISGAVAVLALALAVPILRLRHTIDAATRAINDLNDRSEPLLGNVNTTVDGVNTALGQVHLSLDGVNVQLAKIDAMTGHAQQVTANVANLSTVVAAAASNPLVKVAAFSYGVRKAAAKRRHADEERAVRATLKEQRRAKRRSGR